MVDAEGLATGDPLGIGGLLVDAYGCAQLEGRGADPDGLVERLLEAGVVGLGHSDLRAPASHRLAFRERGLAIGLATLDRDDWPASRSTVRASVDRLSRYRPLRAEIESFWLRPEHRRVDSWREHANINDVMLATSLQPEGFLVRRPS